MHVILRKARAEARGRGSTTWRLVTATALAAGAVVVSAAPASGTPPHECATGEVQAVKQAEPIGNYVVNRGGEIKAAGLGGGVGDGALTTGCQFRLYLDGQTVTFRAGEPFLGGVAYIEPYKAFGETRQEGTAILEGVVDQVWLGPAGGVLVEQDMFATSFRNFVHPTFGPSVYQHRGFIAEFDVGTYEARWETTFSDGTVLTAVTTIEVVP